MAERNRTPEQRARDTIDAKLEQAGWRVQSKNRIDFNAGRGIAVREYRTDVGPADYVLFIDRTPVGVIEAKPEDWAPTARSAWKIFRWAAPSAAATGPPASASF